MKYLIFIYNKNKMVEKMNNLESKEQLDLKNDPEMKFLEGRKDKVNQIFENEENKSKLGKIVDSFKTTDDDQQEIKDL